MYFKQIRVEGLGCLSYAIGCPAVGAMAVIDPKRDIRDYLDISRDEGMKITHIIDTHVHADHVSGTQELRAATGADIYVHESAPVSYERKPLKEGDIITIGAARMEVLHTPGHTPNSISLLTTDLVRSPEPCLIMTGDLLFVGDIGRPDLPGAEILDEQVRNLHDSLYVKLGRLPDAIEVYPAHGQGSLCGKDMSAKPNSTLGYERLANPMLRFDSFEAFKTAILSELPVRPGSFSHIIATNIQGAPLLERCPIEQSLTPQRFAEHMAAGAVVIDTRDSPAFGGAHIPGSFNIGFEKQLANWVGMAVPPKSPLLLVVTDRERFRAMRTELHRIGYDDIIGWLNGGIGAWITSGREIATLPQVSVHDLKAALDGPDPVTLLDVRTPAEWRGGHIDQARHVPFTEILANGAETCLTAPVYVICGSGYRSNIAGSVLKAQGCGAVASVAGGMLAWRRAGLPAVL